MMLSGNCARCGAAFVGTRNMKLSFHYCSHRCYSQHTVEKNCAGLEPGTKRCPRCGQAKSVMDGFSPGQSLRRAGWCRDCRRDDEKQRRADPQSVRRFRAKYEGDMDFRAAKMLKATAKRCKLNGIVFDLDHEWMASRYKSGKCEVTGIPFEFTIANGSLKRRRPHPFTPSIDRIKAGGGYTKDNCRVVVFALNIALSDWGMDVVVRVAEALIARRGNDRAA